MGFETVLILIVMDNGLSRFETEPLFLGGSLNPYCNG